VKILAIDTSGQQAGAAIVDEYITIGEIMINAQSGPKTWHHSEILMPAIERLFALSRQNIEDIDYVAYTAGPGSFTGLRIGAATALGLARGVNKQTVAVPTLDALAYNVLGIGFEGCVVPLMDARRGQVYGAVYQSDERVTDYLALPVEEMLLHVASGSAIFIGDGAEAYSEIIQKKFPSAIFAPQTASRQRPASVGLCAIKNFASLPKSPDNPVELIYVRDPQAVRTAKVMP